VVFLVGVCFPTPSHVLIEARRRAEEAATDDRPMAMRSTTQDAQQVFAVTSDQR
jgi:hypothetical protein